MSSEDGETKRDRVRRLLIGPLQAAGFRFKKGTEEAKAKSELDRIADALAYMSDADLETMAELMLTKGEGAQRCFWPAFATFAFWADHVNPRPLEEHPRLLSWFRSRAGERALQNGALVAEYAYWKQHKAPPVKPQAIRLVEDKARTYNERAALIRDRQRRNFQIPPEDLDWLARFDRAAERLSRIVAEGIEDREGDQAA
ncbi:hypothetical protein GI582_18045 [Sulfitobacter sp. BDSS02]|nr:hypothetical protein [Sulfitobacter sp. BDSS02]MBR9852032.1 hypothetical protein [Paracoccaceae bacterium]